MKTFRYLLDNVDNKYNKSEDFTEKTDFLRESIDTILRSYGYKLISYKDPNMSEFSTVEIDIVKKVIGDTNPNEVIDFSLYSPLVADYEKVTGYASIHVDKTDIKFVIKFIERHGLKNSLIAFDILNTIVASHNNCNES
jgi:hypothetical protein